MRNNETLKACPCRGAACLCQGCSMICEDNGISVGPNIPEEYVCFINFMINFCSNFMHELIHILLVFLELGEPTTLKLVILIGVDK